MEVQKMHFANMQKLTRKERNTILTKNLISYK
jgi:hypothetical protein